MQGGAPLIVTNLSKMNVTLFRAMAVIKIYHHVYIYVMYIRETADEGTEALIRIVSIGARHDRTIITDHLIGPSYA